MNSIQNKIDYMSQRPFLSGMFAVLAVIVIGMGVGFATGVATPNQADAQVAPVIVTAQPPTLPVILPTLVPTPVVTVAPAPTVTPVTPTNTGSSNNGTQVGEVVVTGHTNNDDPVLPFSTPVSGVIVTGTGAGNNDLSPCCTVSNTTPATDNSTQVTGVIVTGTGADNNDLTPCCTVTPPIVPIIPIIPIVPVIVPPVVTTPLAAECISLTGTPNEINPGDAVTLAWQTRNATAISITNTGVGSLTPVEAGSYVVHPTGDTTYVATVSGATGSVHCQTSVHIRQTPPPPPVPAECISLTGTPNEINPGDAVTLVWQTRNATSITITNTGVGALSPVASGSKVVYPTGNTTYVATVTGATGSVNCQTSVHIRQTPPPPAVPACLALTADKTVINPGDAVTLSWSANAAATGYVIDNGIGNVNPAQGGSIVVHPTGDTTYTGTVPNAAFNPACKVSVSIQSVPPTTGCTYNCGGGGGGGGCTYNCGGGVSGGSVILSGVSGSAPQAFVSLSQIPYTGLDLGPFGTFVYWAALIIFCLSAAYLTIFNLLPFLFRKITSAGKGVEHVLNSAPSLAHAGAHGVSHSQAPLYTPAAVQSVAAPVMSAPMMTYKPSEGFKSFAEGNMLTIDDIVKGLSREAAQQNAAAPTLEHGPVSENNEVIAVSAPHTNPVQAPRAAYVAPAPRMEQAPAANISTDVRDFVGALLNADRDTVFGMVRKIVREGGRAEDFLTQVVCAIDDAYRARVEGTKVHPEIAQLTASCSPQFLEALTSALTNGVDSSYSVGITGTKLALTRALGVVEG